MLKFLKKIKPIYIILGLFVVVLLVSALGSRTIEGMSSGDYTSLKTYNSQFDSIIRDINKFVEAQGTSWGSGETFKDNLRNYTLLYRKYFREQFFKGKDSNKDGAVVVSKNDSTFIRDNSDKLLDNDEKLYNYNLNTMDKNQDGTIVAYKDSDQGNFYQDNIDLSGNLISAASLSKTPYILQSISSKDNVSKTQVDAAKSLLDTQINLLTSTADRDLISTSISNLVKVIDKIEVLSNTQSIGSSGTSGPIEKPYTYNPYDFGKGTGSYDYIDDADLKAWIKAKFDAEVKADVEAKVKALADAKAKAASTATGTATSSATGTTTSTTAANNVDYWKNLYLDSLKKTQGQDKIIRTYSLVNPSYSSLLSNNSDPYNARDASSGTGTGTGTASTASTKSKIIDTASYNISQGPVQQGAGTGGAGTTSDSYLLNNSQTAGSNCPVGGCSTAGSSPNNCRPAPVPPCPPCERCPEPTFDCKRVPKYNSAANNQYMPQPVLADFSQFGM